MNAPHPTLSQPWGDPDYDPSCGDCRAGVHGRYRERYPVTTDEYGIRWLKGRVHAIWIEQRPPYCDRGHYLAHVEPTPEAGVEFTIDGHDFWPRYYMDDERMLAELREWLAWREDPK